MAFVVLRMVHLRDVDKAPNKERSASKYQIPSFSTAHSGAFHLFNIDLKAGLSQLGLACLGYFLLPGAQDGKKPSIPVLFHFFNPVVILSSHPAVAKCSWLCPHLGCKGISSLLYHHR